MEPLTLTFPMQPIAHQRSRGKGGQIMPYLPQRMRQYYAELRESVIRQIPPDFKMIESSIQLEIFLGKKWSQIRITPMPLTARLLRGDLDNYAKSICDGLQGKQSGLKEPPPGSLWADDKLIARLTVEEVDIILEETDGKNTRPEATGPQASLTL